MVKRTLIPLLVALSLASPLSARAEKGGTIAGSVVVAQDGKQLTVGDAITYLYVYLEEQKPHRRPGEQVTAQIMQLKEQFEPHVVVVPAGATVWFPNKDLMEHSVFSPPVNAKDVGFDLGRYGKDYGVKKQGKAHQFLEPNEYDIYCDVHMGMWAKVKVVPSTYIVSVKNGGYSFGQLPPGTYRVAAWSPWSIDVKSEWVTIKGDETANVSELHLQTRPRPSTHLRSDGSRYCGAGYRCAKP